MAVAFSYYFGGAQVVFWYKYAIALMWTAIYFVPLIAQRGKISGRHAVHIRTYVYPLLLIFGWTLFIWTIQPPAGLDFSYFTRMTGNIIYLMLAVASAIAAAGFFGRKAIKYSVWAIALSIAANTVYSISIYGTDLFMAYLPQAVSSTDFPYRSALYNLSAALEVQDATMASGFYILYFIFEDKEDDKRTRVFYTAVLLCCSYIGFKRTQFLSILATGLIMRLIHRFHLNERSAINLVGAFFLLFCLSYVVIVKTNVFQIIVDYLGADVTGRQNIYRALSAYFDFSPLYLGKGFGYVDKTMYETIGFASHNTIVRMYAELGFIPFAAWMYWYLIGAPERVARMFGREAAMTILMCTIYLFFTYCIGNSMNFYCIQFSFMLIPIAVACPYETGKYKKIKFVLGNRKRRL